MMAPLLESLMLGLVVTAVFLCLWRRLRPAAVPMRVWLDRGILLSVVLLFGLTWLIMRLDVLRPRFDYTAAFENTAAYRHATWWRAGAALPPTAHNIWIHHTLPVYLAAFDIAPLEAAEWATQQELARLPSMPQAELQSLACFAERWQAPLTGFAPDICHASERRRTGAQRFLFVDTRRGQAAILHYRW